MREALMVQVATPRGIEVVEVLRPIGRRHVMVRQDSTDLLGVRAVNEMLALKRVRLPRRFGRYRQ